MVSRQKNAAPADSFRSSSLFSCVAKKSSASRKVAVQRVRVAEELPGGSTVRSHGQQNFDYWHLPPLLGERSQINPTCGRGEQSMRQLSRD